MNGGEPPASIARAMNIGKKTVYRYKRLFVQPDGTHVPVAPQFAEKVRLERGALLKISGWLHENPKLTLKEIREKLVEGEEYNTIEEVPHSTTIWRRLQEIGFQWSKPLYSDPRAKRDVIRYERCAFRKAQDDGLDPTTLLSIDETNFFFEQATRAWGTSAKPASLEKPKGKVPRRSLYATIGFEMGGDDGEPKAIIHWLLVPPRKSWRPLSDTIESLEIKDDERRQIKARLSPQLIEGLTNAGLRDELKRLGITSPQNSRASMKETLLRVFRSGSREGELRARGKGRPTLGGATVPPTGDARMVSEYLFSCLVPFLRGDGLRNDGGFECETTADEGVASCPDGGKLESAGVGALGGVQDLGGKSILWDSAPSHLPTTHRSITPFHEYARRKLGLAGVVHTPPYSPRFNPIELLFSYFKRYCRKHAPPTTEELVRRLREATENVTGQMIKGWFRKCGFLVPGEDPDQEREPDPNEGVQNRCTLPRTAKFEAREHVSCYSGDGVLRREKRRGHTTWSKYDDAVDEDDLRDLSVSKRQGVRPKKRVRIEACAPPEEGEARWTGLGPEPAGVEHGDHSHLWDDDQYYEVEAIVDERRAAGGGKEYLVKWRGFDESSNEWMPPERFSAGGNSLISNWRERLKRLEEQKRVQTELRVAMGGRKSAHGGGVVPVCRRKDLKHGMTVAIRAESDELPFYLAKILEVRTKEQKLKVHWYTSKKVDGTYQLEYAWPPKGKKGGGKPNVAVVWMHTVIDCVKSLEAKKKGKVERRELQRILRLAREAEMGGNSGSAAGSGGSGGGGGGAGVSH